MSQEEFFLYIFPLIDNLDLGEKKEATISTPVIMGKCIIFTQVNQKVVSKKCNVCLKL